MNLPECPLIPTRDKIVVVYYTEKRESALEIPKHIAESMVETPMGIVVRVGPGVPTADGHIPTGIDQGDLVFFRKNAGHPVSYQGHSYRVLNAGEVLAHIHDS